MALQGILQYLIAVSLPIWLEVEEIIYRCGPSAVNTHEPSPARSPAPTGLSAPPGPGRVDQPEPLADVARGEVYVSGVRAGIGARSRSPHST